MRILYNLAFIIFGLFYLPHLIVTKRYRYGMRDRFGFLPERVRSLASRKKIIWIHAVSLGEMKAVSILAPLLRKAFPQHALLFSSVTNTGNKVARTIATGEEGVFYLPFDLSFITDKVVKLIRPELFISLEAELWPNLIGSLYRRGVKTILVNGRISDRSYRGYKKIRFLVSGIFSKFSLMLMQSEQDAVRILALGAPKEKVSVAGNLKFDLSLPGSAERRAEIRKKLNLSEREILFTAGSTNKGEEEEIIECFSKLKKDYADLRLLVAPRHIERAKDIERILSKLALESFRFSLLNSELRTPCLAVRQANPELVCILDTIGELKAIYSASDIVFVGGSLVKKRGGQNPIEPASLAKPVIMGKYMSNYQDVVRSFVENRGCIQVGSKEELYSVVKSLLDNPKERKMLGMNAKEVVDKNSGSSQRAIGLILSLCEADNA